MATGSQCCGPYIGRYIWGWGLKAHLSATRNNLLYIMLHAEANLWVGGRSREACRLTPRLHANLNVLMNDCKPIMVRMGPSLCWDGELAVFFGFLMNEGKPLMVRMGAQAPESLLGWPFLNDRRGRTLACLASSRGQPKQPNTRTCRDHSQNCARCNT